MRLSTLEQLLLLPGFRGHDHEKELAAIVELLDWRPEELVLVQLDVSGGKPATSKGRPGLTADQLRRALMAKQRNGWSYSEPAFHPSDSQCYQGFCRVPFGR